MARMKVGRVEDIPPGTCQIVSDDKRSIGVFNVKGEFHALLNVCPHGGAPLCKGRVSGMPEATGPRSVDWTREGEILICPWHGWEFDIATGRTVTEPVMRVGRYSVIVEDGFVYVQLDGGSNAD
jgi:nitrite reductase (NADH) small subunit